jgi:hypothetical protein
MASVPDMIALKIERAAKHLQGIKGSITKDAARYGHAFIVESEGKETVDLTLPSECVSHSGPVLTRLIHLVVVVVTVGMWKSV